MTVELMKVKIIHVLYYTFYFMSDVDDNKPILPYLMLFDMLIR